MGTRGYLGFIVDGKLKGQYNHYDSYFEGLGKSVVEYIRGISDLAAIKERVKELQVIPDKDGNYEKYRDCQGDIDAILESGVIVTGGQFYRDSLFCEFGYILNFDTNELEVYVGFRKKKHNKGRFSKLRKIKGENYYPIALVKSFPFLEIPENWIEMCGKELQEDKFGNSLVSE